MPLLVFLTLLLLTSCVAPTRAPEPVTLHVMYSANRQGEIEPCGCQVNQIGGLNRLESFLRKLPPGEPRIFVDSGDTFFSASSVNPRRRDYEAARARTIARSYRYMGLDVFVPGERDFALGPEFLGELQALSGAHFVAANLVRPDGKPLFPPYHVIERSGARVGIVGIVDESLYSGFAQLRATPAKEALEEQIERLRKESVSVVLVLSHSGLRKDQDLASADGLSFIFGAHSLDVLAEPAAVGRVRIMQPQNEGQQVGHLTLESSDGSAYRHRLVDLDVSFDEPNESLVAMKQLREERKELEKESHAPASSQKVAFVANPNACRQCHQEQHDFWESTKHASAYLVLYAKNQHFNSECIGCHTLGFGSEGGFMSATKPVRLVTEASAGTKPFVETLMEKVFQGDPGGDLDSRQQPERYAKLKKRYHEVVKGNQELWKASFLGVQCEHCHGTRVGHPGAAKTLKKVSITSCKNCHRPPNAPEFDPKSISKIACPRMKRS